MRPPDQLPEREAGEDEELASDASWTARLPGAERADHAMRIRRNQFGAQSSSCSRLLLVTNDLHTKGMGAAIRFYGVALLAAVESGRVLHEVPGASSYYHYDWCGQPPYTLECHFMRWNDCPIADHVGLNNTPFTFKKRGHTWGTYGLTPHSAKPVIRVLLSDMYPAAFELSRARYAPPLLNPVPS